MPELKDRLKATVPGAEVSHSRVGPGTLIFNISKDGSPYCPAGLPHDTQPCGFTELPAA